MTAFIQRLRPLLIGLVALLFTAGIAFAGRPAAPASGTSAPSGLSGRTVPVDADDDDEDEADDDAVDATTNVEATTTLETTTTEVSAETEDAGGGDNCATEPTGLTDEQLAGLSHGSIVCWAAHQDAPEGYRNHGAWVSEWAKKNHGHPPTDETATGTTTGAATGAETGAATEASGQPGKGKVNTH